jgi:hypothetical protein
MVKIRITVLPDELESFLIELKKHFFILNVYKAYKNSNSKYVRKYADIKKRGNENE